MNHPTLSPGLEREEPDLWIEDDIPTPAADEAEEDERAQGSEPAQG